MNWFAVSPEVHLHFFMLGALLLVLIWLMLCLSFANPPVHRPPYFCRTSSPSAVRASRKPDWVRKEPIRLNAHLPDFGCRKLADLFNSIYAASGMTVGKSFVCELLKHHAYDVLLVRKLWKSRVPPPLPCNHTWGLDMTGMTDEQGSMHSILGIVDHGSRLAVCLLPLRDQTTIAILRALLDAIERFGKPSRLRTDNGSQFRSILFRCCLKILGIKQQFSKPCMPWMNGKRVASTV